MQTEQELTCRHYVSYSGVKLPLKLITPLEADKLDGRITYFRGYYDQQDRLVGLEKVVYGEIEFEHRYTNDADGRLKTAELIEPDEEPRVMDFS